MDELEVRRARCAAVLGRDEHSLRFDRWQYTGFKYQEDAMLAHLLCSRPVAAVLYGYDRDGTGQIWVGCELDDAGLAILSELVAIAQSTAALEAMP